MGGEDVRLFETRYIKDEPPEIRAGFIQKVYGILTGQLLLTAAVATPFVVSGAVKAFVIHHGMPLLVVVSVLNILFLCFMICPCGCQKNMRTFPTNYLLLGGFTVTEGVLVGVICAQYTIASLVSAVCATGFLCGGLSIYAMWTKRDFTGWGPYLFAAMFVLMIFGIFAMFLPFPIARTIYCCLGILVFSFYLIYDTQLIMGNGELRLSIDEYVFAALHLYLDIIQIFLYILQLIGDRS